MSEQALVPVLGPSEARRLTDEVKRDAEALWQKLVGLYEGGAHSALGYTSWQTYCEAEFGFGRSQSYRLLEAGRVAELVPHGGMNERQARELAPLLDEPDELRDVIRELRERHGDKLTAAKVRHAVDERLGFEQKIGHLTSSRSVEWYTPARYIEAARDVLGGIDLDPASCVEANETVRATRFYDADMDGLEREWHGRVWLNPPYATQGARFVSKLLDEHKAGRVDGAILLVSSYSTETKWFQPLWDHVLCFADHRIDFWSPGREESRNSIMGSVFVYVGPERGRFVQAFSRFGAVVERVKV